MEKYIPQEIEKKWQHVWEESKCDCCTEDNGKPPYYVLEMFPYPSGNLHMGHVRNYTIGDVIARYRRMNGYNVLHPMGYDAFGMPAENAAIKHNIPPAEWTYSNIANMTRQQKALGLSYDWDREVATCHEKYYKWTQWIFELLYKRGLAYRKEAKVNWCEKCNTVLANEQVIEGKCWRCDTPVVKKDLKQWFFKITDYADRLLDDLKLLPGWPERVKTMQKNWIGRSEGLEFSFDIPSLKEKVAVYTTRPDTIYGVTFVVLPPEHPLVHKILENNPKKAELEAFCEKVRNTSDIERTSTESEKIGMYTGIDCVHPLTGKSVQIWITNYVLYDYGTGAVMGVPTGDQRDWMFATKYNIPKIITLQPKDHELKLEDMDHAYEDKDGVLVNAGPFTGMEMHKAMKAIIDYMEEKGLGKRRVNYRLRDWLISRQRYWGEPIPLVNCPKCGWVAIPEEELPLRLPEVESYEPTDNGESPLAKLTDWVKTTCPCCGGPAERETDTMPQWAGSSWYFLRYCDPHNANALAAKEALDYWMPVDWYNGGMEHTTLHLLYSRFWHKFLYDIGVVSCKEPYAKRTSHGMILGENGEKMSKSRGNVVNPDDVIAQYGADTLRMYEMFIGDFEKTAPWNTSSIKGVKRFLERVAALTDIMTPEEGYSPELEGSFHKLIRKVSEDIEGLKCNTAIAAMMSVLNEINDKGSVTRGELRTFITLLNPFAPHLTEEMNEAIGGKEMLVHAKWPEYDPAKCVDAAVEIAVQVSGKIKARLMIPSDAAEEEVKALVMADANVQAALAGKSIIKEIYVKGKLYNIVAK